MSGTPKIADFGLARALSDEGHTQTGDVLGTPSYMAPESTRAESANRDSLSIVPLPVMPAAISV